MDCTAVERLGITAHNFERARECDDSEIVRYKSTFADTEV
jgi:hypothetical protein